MTHLGLKATVFIDASLHFLRDSRKSFQSTWLFPKWFHVFIATWNLCFCVEMHRLHGGSKNKGQNQRIACRGGWQLVSLGLLELETQQRESVESSLAPFCYCAQAAVSSRASTLLVFVLKLEFFLTARIKDSSTGEVPAFHVVLRSSQFWPPPQMSLTSRGFWILAQRAELEFMRGVSELWLTQCSLASRWLYKS